jgi:hypothetical protein
MSLLLGGLVGRGGCALGLGVEPAVDKEFVGLDDAQAIAEQLLHRFFLGQALDDLRLVELGFAADEAACQPRADPGEPQQDFLFLVALAELDPRRGSTD